MTAVAICFWGSLAGLAYIFAGYPLLVGLLARVRRRRESPHETLVVTPVDVLLAAHNETEVLAAKLRQLADDPLVAAIHVGIDGADPAVVAAAESVAASVATSVANSRAGASSPPTGSVLHRTGIHVHPFPKRRGKPAILSELMSHVGAPTTVLVDARQPLADGAIAALCRRLQDPAIGVVSGELIFRTDDDATSASEGVGAYWRYEKFIRKSEAAFRSVPGATGALYAIRSSLLRPIPPNTLLDDVVIPMQAIEQGARCVFEPAAIVYDRPSTEPAREAVRKRRTIAGAAQLIVAQPRWLLPWRNPIWWEYVSHKLARLAAPFLLVATFVANAVLAWPPREHPGYALLFFGQVACYLAAGAGAIAQRRNWRIPGLSLPLMFVTLNGTTALALVDAVRGRFTATWERSEAEAPASASSGIDRTAHERTAARS